MNPILWKLEHVSLAGAPRLRLADVCVEVRAGVTAVVGYSGAGKTSLLNVLTGFEPPDSGRMLETLPASRERLPLFWVPQHNGLWPHLTVAEHLEAVMPACGIAAPQAGTQEKQISNLSSQISDSEAQISDLRSQISNFRSNTREHNSGMSNSKSEISNLKSEIHPIETLLYQFDLAEKSASYPDQLSQGECARLAVARALASDAAVLVMDEPLVHIDPARVGKYWHVVRNYCRDRSISLVFSTHSAETALREATEAICLTEGRIVYQGPVLDLYYRPHSPELAEFLGPANWLPVAAAMHWLGVSQLENLAEEGAGGGSAGASLDRTNPVTTSTCFRPEQIQIARAAEGPFVVQSSEFAGSIAEVELRDERTDERRRFFHRPAGGELRPGDRVALHVVLAMLVCLLAAGCRSGTAAATILPVQTVRYWSMPPEGASVPAPRAVTCGPDNSLYVLDNAGRVLVFDEAGALLRRWWMPDYSVGKPEGICLFKDGRVAVADTHYHRVVFFDRQGKELGRMGTLGRKPGEFIYPVAIVQDDAENFYVCEYGDNDRVQKFTKTGKFLAAFGSFGTEPGQFQRPSGIVWHEKRVYVVDAFNNRIQAFSDSGEFLEVLGAKQHDAALQYPYDITASQSGELYVIEYGAGRVSKFDLQGRLLGQYGTTGPGENQFSTPWGLGISSNSRLFVADTGNRRIVELQL